MIDVSAEIAAGKAFIRTLPKVLDFALIGSASYLPNVNDVDFAVLIHPGADPVDYCSKMVNAGWGKCGDYDGTGGTWAAVRRKNLNLMVTHDPKFFADYKTAMEVCKALNLVHKEDRIAVCQIVRDGKKAFDVLTHAKPSDANPIDMVLYCPACHVQHIDAVEDLPMAIPGSAAEGSAGWTNPPHRSHLCHNCGHIWRPADVPTNGVAFIKTAGKHDSPKPSHPDNPKTLELIAEFGEQHRRLILDAVRFLDDAESRWSLLAPCDRRSYIKSVIARQAK